MLAIDYLPGLVEDRQERLRALAGRRAEHPAVTALRRTASDALIRLGTKLDGYHPDARLGPSIVTGSQSST